MSVSSIFSERSYSSASSSRSNETLNSFEFFQEINTPQSVMDLSWEESNDDEEDQLDLEEDCQLA